MSDKIKHKIYVRHSKVKVNDRLPIPLIKHCILVALDAEGVDLPCEVSVLVTDERSIRNINREFREIDEPTDVLSFPMHGISRRQSAIFNGWEAPDKDALDPETGLLPLGEIVLAAAIIGRQALEYGHSRDYETAYLTVHSVLHLLGYNHVDEAEGKKMMREREKDIIGRIWGEG